MDDLQQIEQVAQKLIGSYGWMAFGAFAMFFFKDVIQSMAEGVSLMMGNDINPDDVIYISGRKARVVRVGLRKTIFYMRDRGTKMIITNTQLKKLTLEKKLMHNGDHPKALNGKNSNNKRIRSPCPQSIRIYLQSL